MGIETEYGLMCASTEGGTPPLDPEETAAELFRAVLESGLSTNAFLANGARLYLDVGAHPEYATAECRTVADLVAHDRAGELLFAGMAAEANERLAARGVPGRIHLFKNNLDAAGNSYGCHENYLVRRRPDYRARISTMLPFFVTRQIVAGAGCLRRGEDGVTRFAFSQRADQMWDAISSASTRSRPMINTRDEPHGDPELYRRMHVIVGDSNVAEPATALKVAATEALLVLVEDGAVLPGIRLADPVEAIRAASLDLTGRAPLALQGGGVTTPVDVQRRMLEAVLAHYDARGYAADLPEGTRYLFDLWGRAIDAVASGDHADAREKCCLDSRLRPRGHRDRDRLGGQTRARRAVHAPQRRRTGRSAPGPARPRLPRRHRRGSARVDGVGRAAAHVHRPRGRRAGLGQAAAEHASQAARGVRRQGQATPLRLRRRLDEPQTARSRGDPHGRAQGPVLLRRRASRRTHG